MAKHDYGFWDTDNHLHEYLSSINIYMASVFQILQGRCRSHYLRLQRMKQLARQTSLFRSPRGKKSVFVSDTCWSAARAAGCVLGIMCTRSHARSQQVFVSITPARSRAQTSSAFYCTTGAPASFEDALDLSGLELCLALTVCHLTLILLRL